MWILFTSVVSVFSEGIYADAFYCGIVTVLCSAVLTLFYAALCIVNTVMTRMNF